MSIYGPLTATAQHEAERAYAEACADPYFNDGDDAYDNHWRASLAVIRDYEREAGSLLLVDSRDAHEAAWVAVGIERELRYEFAAAS